MRESSMKYTKDDWNPTCERFVAFLDIMGFKETVLRCNHDELYKLLIYFSHDFKPVKEYEKASREKIPNLPIQDPEGYKSIVKIVFFSDSIIMFSYNESRNSFISMLLFLRWILRRALEKNLPLKGALA